jgi:ABC-type bacteriocin/lantibiotic exporter with double-glycine peptidase domain
LIVECVKVVYLIYQLTTKLNTNEKRNRTTFSRIFSSLLPYRTITRHLLEMIYAICLLLIATGFVMAALTDYIIKHNDTKRKRIHRQILRK